MKRLIFLVRAFAIFTIMSIIAVFTISSVISAVEAEKNLHAIDLVIDLTCEYINENGKWPSSWAALKDVKPANDHGTWLWPDDILEINSRIRINFRTPMDGDMAVASIEGSLPTYGASEAWKGQLRISFTKVKPHDEHLTSSVQEYPVNNPDSEN